jgi:hypothetical protein
VPHVLGNNYHRDVTVADSIAQRTRETYDPFAINSHNTAICVGQHCLETLSIADPMRPTVCGNEFVQRFKIFRHD